MFATANNPMNDLSPDERRKHTIPGRRALMYRAAERAVNRIVSDPCLLTDEQLVTLAWIFLDARSEDAS